MDTKENEVIIFLITTALIILILTGFIITIFFLYSKKQAGYKQHLVNLELHYEKALLSTQLEIQEQTFQNISREIHDNIGLSLTLAKLQLNTVDIASQYSISEKVEISIEQITKAITDLTLLSKSLNSEYIEESGLIKALEMELARIERSNVFKCELHIIGNPCYIDSKKEVVVFRIIQEALNNAIKHSGASRINVSLKYFETCLDFSIQDDGKGFDAVHVQSRKVSGSGLKNISHRAQVVNATCRIENNSPTGVLVNIVVPLNNNNNNE